MGFRRALRALALTFAIAGLAPSVRAADPREAQLAQALFDEARQLMEQKRFSEACPKLAESERLDPGGGTLLNLALCHEKEGKLSTAQWEYNEALSLALRDNRKDRQDLAREHVRLLEERIPRLTVAVLPPSDMVGLEVKLDGLALPREAWGLATPVDAGLHHIEATAPGRTSWSGDVAVVEREKKKIDVPLLSPLPLLAKPPEPLTPSGAPGSVNAQDVAAQFVPVPTHANPWFYGALAVTGVAVATSTVTGIMALSANREATDSCLSGRNYCRDGGSASDRTTTLAWVSTVSLGIGLLGALAVAVLPSRVQRNPEPRLGAAFVPGGGALHLAGEF